MELYKSGMRHIKYDAYMIEIELQGVIGRKDVVKPLIRAYKNKVINNIGGIPLAIE